MRGVVVLLLIAACGDNIDAEVDAPEACVPPPSAEIPFGPLSDPLALPLPSTCIEGGLRDLPGRWFVKDPEARFSYLYPKYGGSCAYGFFKDNWYPDDHDASDGWLTHTWSDGTRIYNRDYITFDGEEAVLAYAACMTGEDELTVLDMFYFSGYGLDVVTMTGGHFEPRDERASGLTLLGSVFWSVDYWPIFASSVAVDGTFAYVAGDFGLDVIAVDDTSQPRAFGHLDGDFTDVEVVRAAGYIVAVVSPSYSFEDTLVIDVTNPRAPVVLARIRESSRALFVDGTNLYLATYADLVAVYDISSPTAPVRVGEIRVPGPSEGVDGLYVDGDLVHVNNTTGGMVTMDKSAGLDTAVERGRVETSYSHASWPGTAGGRAIIAHGDRGMTPEGGAFLRVFDGDAASSAFLRELGRYQSRPEVSISDMQLVGDRVYIAYHQDGVRVVDVADPTNPREVAHYNTWDDRTAFGFPSEGARGIRVVDGLIYVADSDKGLMIFR